MAFRATRIEPIAAVREGAVLPPSRFARYAVPASAAIVVVAVALFSYGLFAHGIEIKVRILSLVAGVLFMFVAVAMVASRVVRPLAFVLGAPGAGPAALPGDSLARTRCGTRRGRHRNARGEHPRPALERCGPGIARVVGAASRRHTEEEN